MHQETHVATALWAMICTKIQESQDAQIRSADGAFDQFLVAPSWILVWHPSEPHRPLKTPWKPLKTAKNGLFSHFCESNCDFLWFCWYGRC